MRGRLLAVIVGVLNFIVIRSQTDSIALSSIAKLEDGIYLNYSDFRHNRPITKEQIVSKIEKNQLEFIGKAMFESTITFKRNDSLITLPTKNFWGFYQNNTLYINYREEFYRVPVFGSISYLVANVTVSTPGFYDPRFGGATGTVNTREIREFLVNFYDGQVIEFTQQSFEDLLGRDAQLFDEYNKLNRRKKKDELYRFIRRYNEKHPVYFLT